MSDKTVCQNCFHVVPKREWVGLTDEDKAELCRNNFGSMLHSNAERDFALVEAKLKEKNT